MKLQEAENRRVKIAATTRIPVTTLSKVHVPAIGDYPGVLTV